jgi:hypothetical protein
MWRPYGNTPILALLWLLLGPPLFGGTILAIVEEYRAGDLQGTPSASQEGLMSAMFDLGHITFETGLYRPEMSWERMQFAEPLRLAREGGAGYLAVVRVFAESNARAAVEGGTGDQLSEGRRLDLTTRAEYLLFDADSSTLLGRGEVQTSSAEAGRELTYDELLFQTGERVAGELAKLCGPAPEP